MAVAAAAHRKIVAIVASMSGSLHHAFSALPLLWTACGRLVENIRIGYLFPIRFSRTYVPFMFQMSSGIFHSVHERTQFGLDSRHYWR